MRHSMSFALICAGLAATCSGFQTAHAADVPTGVYPQYQPAGVVTEFVSGWYLRGDIGWRADTKIGEVYSTFPVPSGISLDNIVTGGATVQTPKGSYKKSMEQGLQVEALDNAVRGAQQKFVGYLTKQVASK